MNYLAFLLVPLMVSAQASDPAKPTIVTTKEATVSGKWEVYSASGALLVSCDALFPMGESKIISLQSCTLAPGVSLDNAMFAIMQINHRLEEQVKPPVCTPHTARVVGDVVEVCVDSSAKGK